MKTLLRELLFPLIAVLAAFIIGGLIVLAIGDNPIEVYRLLLSSAFSLYDALGNFTFDNWGYTLFYATPLIFTGLAVALAFKCGLLNIGAEEQLYIGAFEAAWVGITLARWPGFALVFLWRTKWGYDVRAVRSDPSAASLGDALAISIEVYRLLLSSAFSLYDALSNFTFDNYRYSLFYATGLIFTGIAVALLGRN